MSAWLPDTVMWRTVMKSPLSPATVSTVTCIRSSWSGWGGSPHRPQGRAVGQVDGRAVVAKAVALVQGAAASRGRLQVGGQPLGVGTGEALAQQRPAEPAALRLGPDTEQHQVQVRGAGRVPGPGQLQERAEAGELVRDRRRVVGRLGGAGQPDGDRRPSAERASSPWAAEAATGGPYPTSSAAPARSPGSSH